MTQWDYGCLQHSHVCPHTFTCTRIQSRNKIRIHLRNHKNSDLRSEKLRGNSLRRSIRFSNNNNMSGTIGKVHVTRRICECMLVYVGVYGCIWDHVSVRDSRAFAGGSQQPQNTESLVQPEKKELKNKEHRHARTRDVSRRESGKSAGATAYTHLHPHTSTYSRIHARTPTYIEIHARTHTYIHTRPHTPMSSRIMPPVSRSRRFI